MFACNFAADTGAVLAENFWGLAPERCRLSIVRKYNCSTRAVYTEKKFEGVRGNEAPKAPISRRQRRGHPLCSRLEGLGERRELAVQQFMENLHCGT